MVTRRYWLAAIEDLLTRRSVLWISGVRRSGKTFLCHSIKDAEYFDCERPRTRMMLRDPESFLEGLGPRRIVLDEIHKLDDPAELLKLAADYHPEVKVIATGSSSIAATRKFKDTLAGRKFELHLTPINSDDMSDFGRTALDHRLLNGGLPPFFLAEGFPEMEAAEWLDAYWARDVLDLFKVEKRTSFLKFMELLFGNSGGIFEANSYAAPCEVGRSTIASYLSVLEATLVANVVKPYSTRKSSEIVSAPKVYAFDTGFVCYFKGWETLRNEDRGILWEHFVLNEMLARQNLRRILYWRDKRGHEVDFVLAGRGAPPTAIECKWKGDQFDPRNLISFRGRYPEGPNLVVCHDAGGGYTRKYGNVEAKFTTPAGIVPA